MASFTALRKTTRLPLSGRQATTNVRPLVTLRSATNDDKTPTTGAVFYGGKAYPSEEAFLEAIKAGKFAQPVPARATAQNTSSMASFDEVMAFSGSGPEIINGRLAMLGFVAALAAELTSGQSVLKQLAEEPTGVALALIIFIAASYVTLFNRTSDSLGPFNAKAELLNGRAAMIGFAAMLAIEAFKGAPLF